jgi:uncharacterized protein with NRDE domain
MCLILFSYAKQPDYQLILAANRDEFYDRPTQPLSVWHDAPKIYGGRDIRGQGTWLGISLCGRVAALTNYRDPTAHNSKAPSRGLLIRHFLEGSESPHSYLEGVQKTGHKYNGFNLLVGDRAELCYYSNRNGGIKILEPGIYGLSNHLLNTNWPKIVKGKEHLMKILTRQDGWEREELFNLLSDRGVSPDDQLPDTGVELEWERILSPLFITSSVYGTRSSSVLLIKNSGDVIFEERTFEPNPPESATGHSRIEMFSIEPNC